MTAVLLTPPMLQFFAADGVTPLAGGKVYTYTSTGGTFSTLKATFTNAGGLTSAPNPVILDAAGRPETGLGGIWLSGTYDFKVTTSADVTVGTQLAVTAFTALAASSTAYFQSFSGTGSQTEFTTSSDLGADEKAIYVWVDSGLGSCVSNGTFASDTIWTKGVGWTIAAGVATAAGAISTALSQTSILTLVEGQAYRVTYTITRSAGGLIPSVGGTSGTERVLSGTYSEVIIAGSTQAIAFTGSSFTGTLDTVSINVASTSGYQILNPNAYTISATTLTFNTAPLSGTNNIYVSAPSLLVGAASSSAADAAASAASAATKASEASVSAAAAVVSASAASASATTSATQASNASGSATTASQWATLTTGLVSATDYSAKAYAVGGTGTTTNNSKYYSEQAAALALGSVLTMTEQGSTPTTPTAGVSKVYVDSNSAINVLDDTGLIRRPARIQIYAGIHSTPFSDELPLNASSIAKTSGGTYNGAGYERVFTYLWTYGGDTQFPVSSGRGASAAADFAANKTLTLPDFRDRALVGIFASGSITTVGATAGATTVTSTGSIVTDANTGATTLTTAQIPSHAHGGHAGGGGSGPRYFDNSGGSALDTAAAGGGSSHTHPSPTSVYTGTSTSVLQKSIGVYWYITI